MTEDCIFCKIWDKKVPSEILYEDPEVIAFKDINPLARVHILIVPKKHIATIAEIKEADESLLGHMIYVAKKLGDENKLKSYQLQFNVGRAAGQLVWHVHLHLMSH